MNPMMMNGNNNQNKTNKKDWSFENNRNLYITGSIALSTVLFSGISYLFKKYKPVSLNKWLTEYLQEVKEAYKDIDKENMPVNFASKVMNLVEELKNYLFSTEMKELEDDRRSNIKDEKVYSEIVMETVEVQERYYQKATDVLYRYTGVDMAQLNKVLQNEDMNVQREFKVAMATQKKKFYDSDLPDIDRQTLIEAYITYAKTLDSHTRIQQEQMFIMQKKPEYQEIAFKTIFQNKFILKDTIMIKYKIETKYLDQLVEKHNLLDGSEANNEILYWNSIVKNHQMQTMA
jgi:hypothetical protein